ncbi:MAG: hypothetical protein GY765_19200 [bacterium]|nr:hypothetical protein [bacterium]
MKTDRMYKIACSFPVLKAKGVEDGEIPGITPSGFYDEKLSDFHCNACWSQGELLVLEFLLNLYNPHAYKKFNFGLALGVWDYGQIRAFMEAVIQLRRQ